ncbi:Ogr/Delta-like zinc finger [Pseudomonas sp. Snoq117.2]|nr:Ogr/Delta-like zinc finger [Pseudomonas sp. Snoq117.2]
MILAIPQQTTPALPNTCSSVCYKSAAYRSSVVQGKLGTSRNQGVPTMTNTPKSNRNTTPRRRCPDCGASLVKRSSTSKHLLLSRTFLICRNPVCGATFLGIDEITHRLSPSSQPNPDVTLPYAPNALRRAASADLEQDPGSNCPGQVERGAA